ncbi:MAG TPA: DUF2272 domain-containing protein [Allosphingosinicella sp.]
MSYRPPSDILAAYPQLEQIALSGTALPTAAFHRRPPTTLRLLPGGQMYFESRLELDTDGWPGGNGRGDRHYQSATSYRLADKTSIDANIVPYFVLPQPVDWVKGFRIWLGDVAAVLYENKLAFAVFADFGGRDSMGEGSLELFRQLGMERLDGSGNIINRGSPRDGKIVTIVFPASRPALKYNTMQDVISETKRRGEEHFSSLVGSAAQPSPAASLPLEIVRRARRELDRFGGYAENVEPLNSRIRTYWDFLGKLYDGTDSDQYWSAAFISFVMHRAEAGSSFTYNQRHSQYIYQAIKDRVNGRTGKFWGYRPQDLGIAPGDVLAMNQGGSRIISFDEARHDSQYSSHCDVVVDAKPNAIETIGGNVGRPPGTIGTKTFVWERGQLVRKDNKEQQVFAVLRPPATGM